MPRLPTLLHLSLALAALLAGCSSLPPWSGKSADPPSSPSAPAPSRPPPERPAARGAAVPADPAASTPRAAPPAGPLAAEQRWLADLFAGTPVQVVAERDGAVRVEVPLRHAFDHGSAQIKPALQAVLDRVGQSLKRRPGTRLAQWAPGAEGAARQRAIREHLIGLGLPSHRVSVAAAPVDSYSVVLRLSMPPSPVQRLGVVPPGEADGGAPLRPPAAG